MAEPTSVMQVPTFSRGSVAMSAPADICVLADDLSGAAEAAATFLGRTPAPQLVLEPEQAARPGITVVDLHMRGLPQPRAASLVRTVLDRIPPDRLTVGKVDSLLRGHVGAVVEMLAERGPVVVAGGLPSLGRTVHDGVLHVDGVPLHRTDLWHLEAVRAPASITELIEPPSRRCSSSDDIVAALTGGAVAVCDVATDADLDAVVGTVRRVPRVQLVGTAALTAALARTLRASTGSQEVENRGTSAVLIVVGTGAMNAAEQVARLVSSGATPFVIDFEGLISGTADPGHLSRTLATHAQVVLTVSGSVPMAQRASLSAALGRYVAASDCQVPSRPDLVLTGGETARSVIDALGIAALQPVGVVHHGAVVCVAPDGRRIVTRPGSFGNSDSFVDITAHLGLIPRSTILSHSPTI
jgi:4-hydroxythreonine-4-phosphate dehydrogenase